MKGCFYESLLEILFVFKNIQQQKTKKAKNSSQDLKPHFRGNVFFNKNVHYYMQYFK